jgi:hypothetical protein
MFCQMKAKGNMVYKKPISQSTLLNQLKLFGEISGFRWNLFTHRFQYGGDTIMNKNDKVSFMPFAPCILSLTNK